MRIGLLNIGVIIAYIIGYLVGYIPARKRVKEYRKKLQALQEFEKMTQERNERR